MAEVDNRKHLLEVEHLKMYFPSRQGGKKIVTKAVDDVSFFVREAETFGLVGESGCGKTTTGRTIIRLYNATSGSVKLDGREIAGKMDKDLHEYITQNLGMIFQDPIDSLNPRMTVEEIISEGLRVRGEKNKKVIHDKVIEVLEKVDMEHLLEVKQVVNCHSALHMVKCLDQYSWEVESALNRRG